MIFLPCTYKRYFVMFGRAFEGIRNQFVSIKLLH